MIRNSSQINKSSDLPNGVYRFVEYDKRLANPVPKVGFGALVYVDGKKRIKKFRVTTGITEQYAQECAEYFRLMYEQSLKYGTKFDYNFIDHWNKKGLTS